MDYLLSFLAGVFLCNAVPHVVSGLRGDVFPTPFAKPPGKGNSSALVNTLWGSANLFVGAALAARALPQTQWAGFVALAVGWLVIGAMLALHFSAVRGAPR